MKTYTSKNGVLNAILSVLNVGLEIILAFIVLGFAIGIWELLR